ncbi:MAG: amidohydrolase family protein [Defluviicoccus sp.]|nr:amidohydrolase family protein [Defluviicoccus sp.]MDE0386115.1 amidohydrolase family protein [Defluviicoccus sp.]
MTETIAIRARWALLPDGAGQRIETDRWVLVEGGRIAAVTADRPGGADRVIDVAEALVLPGFVNLHNHGISALLFRGIVEDRPTASWAADTVYGLIMPLQGLAMEVLDAEELRAVTALGLLGLVKGGATTVMDQFRIAQAVSFDVADELGIRFYGMPYLFSTEDLGIGADGRPLYAARAAGESDLVRAAALFDAHDGRADGRIRAGFGPHGTDSCDPELLAGIRDAVADRGAAVTIHVSQSATEGETLQSRYGRTPTEQLAHVGLLGPGLVAAHCVYASDADLALIADAGATVVNCPASFARGAVPAVWQRTAARGIRTGIGLDGYAMDTIGELRTAALVSKLASGRSEDASARDLVAAATACGAAALGRGDIGRIAPGCRADLVVVGLGGARLAPVSDPLKTMVWHAGSSDIAAVLVDGRVVVEDGRHLLVDEEEIVAGGAAAVRKVWNEGRARGYIKDGEIVG